MTTLVEYNSVMWARRERKITVTLESRDGALLKTKLLVR